MDELQRGQVQRERLHVRDERRPLPGTSTVRFDAPTSRREATDIREATPPGSMGIAVERPRWSLCWPSGYSELGPCEIRDAIRANFQSRKALPMATPRSRRRRSSDEELVATRRSGRPEVMTAAVLAANCCNRCLSLVAAFHPHGCSSAAGPRPRCVGFDLG
jgi:hypothetical protein